MPQRRAKRLADRRRFSRAMRCAQNATGEGRAWRRSPARSGEDERLAYAPEVERAGVPVYALVAPAEWSAVGISVACCQAGVVPDPRIKRPVGFKDDARASVGDEAVDPRSERPARDRAGIAARAVVGIDLHEM